MLKNRNIGIIALIAVVNALGYGIVIPVLYSYSIRFGLSDFQNGLLFALYSVCQFISTPIIGRLSDKFGRRPLLVTSLAGTAISFALMAVAPSALFLFIARMLDGLTAGNLPVAQAVISDTTTPSERAKGFGLIGAAFGFGFVFGPAISALTVGISAATPFIIAAVVSTLAVIVTFIFLPETNNHMGEISKGKMFDFKHLYHALFDPNVGPTFLISFIYSLAFSLFVYAFQPFSIRVLGLSPSLISAEFTLVGIVGLIMQALVVQKVAAKFGLKRSFSTSLVLLSVAFGIQFLSGSFAMFVVSLVVLSVANSVIQPLINTILSRETDEKSQGSMLGLNVSYMSMGQILGPIIGGVLASISIRYPFLLGAVLCLLCFGISSKILRAGVHKESAF